MLILDGVELPRFMQCNANKRLPNTHPIENTDNTVREEGIAAHWVIEQTFKGFDVSNSAAPNGVIITADMLNHAKEYLQSLDIGSIEESLKLECNEYSVYLRPDHIKYRAETKTIKVDDFKYGYRLVEPENNWTLIAYAWAFCAKYGLEPEFFEFTIHQPRASHPLGDVRTWEISDSQFWILVHKLNDTLVNPSETLTTGPACNQCHKIAGCPAAIAAGLNAIDMTEEVFDLNIDNDQLDYQLIMYERAIDILEERYDALKELGKHRITEGSTLKNFSLEPRLGNTTWIKNMTPELLAVLTGKDLSVVKLPTMAEMKRNGFTEETLGNLTYRPPLPSKLVRVDHDKIARKKMGVK